MNNDNIQDGFTADELLAQVNADNMKNVMPKIWKVIFDNRQRVVSSLGYTIDDGREIANLGVTTDTSKLINAELIKKGFVLVYDPMGKDGAFVQFRLMAERNK